MLMKESLMDSSRCLTTQGDTFCLVLYLLTPVGAPAEHGPTSHNDVVHKVDWCFGWVSEVSWSVPQVSQCTTQAAVMNASMQGCFSWWCEFTTGPFLPENQGFIWCVVHFRAAETWTDTYSVVRLVGKRGKNRHLSALQFNSSFFCCARR